ncbi:MAG: hypothetical protein KJZ93_00760 [Caldilineaceae bacterium]|nr:hypothetical protein [Caldilineaceae bacterium]
MPTRLTLRRDQRPIEHTDASDELPPIMQALLGILGDAEVDEQDYRRHLEKKHGPYGSGAAPSASITWR